MRVKDIPFHDRPRERAWRNGIEVLSDAELLAILLRNGRKGTSAIELAHEIMRTCNGKITDVSSAMESLSSNPSLKLGKVQALMVRAAVEWGKRASFSNEEPQTIDDALDFTFSRLRESPIEKTFLVLLNLRNQCIGFPLALNEGTRSSVTIDLKDVFSRVARHQAARFVLVHNHPSGDVSPSPQDVLLTKQLVEGAKWIGVEFHDHVIVSRTDSLSFRSRGWLD